ncbi:cysteine three histidine 1 [Maylandia zebra]|uniref:cysteine three histidine 1 n=1 Tax=Maylandia zebra TaxID=106582 RepID=UPI000E419970|nr:mRNA decay activator protein ZFP36L2-like [Astatotilapia calliptera]
MFKTSSKDLFLPSPELLDSMQSVEESDGDCGGSAVSLAEALLPVTESSPPPIPWVCSTRYKTELCTTYSDDGFCKYAERCQFAHGLHELHVPSHHPKYKTELCRSYHTDGYCYYGNRCLFVHSPTEQRPTLRRRRNVPCRTFRAFGICPFGTRCNFLHVEGKDEDGRHDLASVGEKTAFVQKPKGWKPRGALCHTFSTFGFCLYGTRCHFQHGLPNRIKTSSQHNGLLSTCASRLPSASDSSASSSPPPTTPEAPAHNAFTFSSQHLNDLLLPLALHLQKLESTKAQDIWANRRL